MTRRYPRAMRAIAIAAVLAVAALVVPDSAVKSTEAELVRIERAEGVDLSPEVVWILAVGSDARPGEDMTRTRGDALQLIGMNTATGAATSIGVPRDSWVDIPGHGHDKINAALYYGGPQLLGRAVGNLVGIQPDYVFITRFKFFQAMITDIGGIDVVNPIAFNDEFLKPKGFKAGRLHLGGYDSLVFARIRHNLLRGDFDRSANQQRVLRGIQATVRAKADRPGFIERGVLSVMAHMHTDLSPAELYRLAQAVAQVRPGRITGCVVQGGIGNVNGASVVLPYVDQARRLGDDARKDAVISRC
ncbi:LytR family transcriptional regulator [Nocardioides sp. MAH-18]|uniref:LytR family transcriptional regulator n=1 Tax=Nocardioides agri TaxID=2682843 RepID=A0A6L6XLK4_9ACTN|nr:MULTISPECIES: LCP family protein [unclassified Nocardioides]MBA2956628.1 LCP family protein [Nocardioides sp. CGMCC 1.13656]MVQ47772.1 LytR family transcriptional regulator [Nocardioides sp. MAH-18]